MPTASDAASLIYTGVDAMVPEAPTVTVLLKLLLSVLTSKPVGGLTNIPAVINAPDTLKLVDGEAVPTEVLNAAGVPVDAMAGA